MSNCDGGVHTYVGFRKFWKNSVLTVFKIWLCKVSGGVSSGTHNVTQQVDSPSPPTSEAIHGQYRPYNCMAFGETVSLHQQVT